MLHATMGAKRRKIGHQVYLTPLGEWVHDADAAAANKTTSMVMIRTQHGDLIFQHSVAEQIPLLQDLFAAAPLHAPCCSIVLEGWTLFSMQLCVGFAAGLMATEWHPAVTMIEVARLADFWGMRNLLDAACLHIGRMIGNRCQNILTDLFNHQRIVIGVAAMCPGVMEQLLAGTNEDFASQVLNHMRCPYPWSTICLRAKLWHVYGMVCSKPGRPADTLEILQALLDCVLSIFGQRDKLQPAETVYIHSIVYNILTKGGMGSTMVEVFRATHQRLMEHVDADMCHRATKQLCVCFSYLDMYECQHRSIATIAAQNVGVGPSRACLETQ